MTTRFSARTPRQIVAYLDNIILPCTRTELLRCAEDNEAPDSILDAIESLPNRLFVSISDIIRTIAPTGTRLDQQEPSTGRDTLTEPSARSQQQLG